VSNVTAGSPASFVGSIPEQYDRHLGPVIFEPYAADLAARLSLAPGARVLEVACGTGIVTRRLLAALPADGRLVATDLNPPMIDWARSRLPADPRLELKPADAQALPFADASFDVVVCQFGVMFFPDKPLAMREARRVLAPGGRLVFNVWGTLAENPFGRIAHGTIGGFFTSDPPQFYNTPFGWADEGVIRATVAGAGFSDVRVDTVEAPVSAESAADFAIGLVRGNPVLLAIQERGVDPEAVTRAVAEALVAFGGDRPFRCPTKALVASARA
jgi:SAM-dependent methyltransferase